MDQDRRLFSGVAGTISRGVGDARREGHAGAFSGVTGSIRWHYYTAAAIEGYTVTRSADGTRWGLTATVVLHDAFKMAQTPLVFVALRTKHGLDGHTVVKSAFRWPILSCQFVDHQLTARLGPPTEED